MKTVVIINNDGMGHGDAQLGRDILAVFLRKARAIRSLEAIVFYNHGVKLVAEGSPVLPELTMLHENGVELRPCGTCLERFGLADRVAVGEVSGMDQIISELDQAERVITL